MTKKINLKLMEKFFVDELGFQSLSGVELYGDDKIEEELYLRIPGDGYISIVKYFDNDEYDINIQSNSQGIVAQSSKYIMYFTNREQLEQSSDVETKNFISQMNNKIKEFEK